MTEYRVYVNGDLIGIETFTKEEVRTINECKEIRLIRNK